MKKYAFLKELRDFLLLWSSQAVSALGTAMTNYALIIWTYGQEGSASSLTLLTLCSFLPTILFRFMGGALADRWNKKRILLFSDLFAAMGTAAVFVLYSLSALRIRHLYLINVLLSLMNAVQAPASFAAVSLLTPKKHYARAGGLQGISGSAVSILAPVLGGVLLSFGGLETVLIVDLVSFSAAFLTLLFLIRIPETRQDPSRREPFFRSCTEGIRFLKAHRALLRLTLFFTAVNFLAKLGNDGMISPFVLGRSGNDQQALGLVQSAASLGILAGSLLVTGMKPSRDRTKTVFLSTAFIFAGNIIQSLTASPWAWSAAAFVSYLTASVMNANLTAVMREKVPPELQGRVFSARDTLQNCAIPLALLLGGVLAVRLFEPFMAACSPLQRILSPLFGTGTGSGIAVMFFLVGLAGIALSLTQLFTFQHEPGSKTL
ncbi:MAG: MFS transporter [Oscillospiraceae bacterium]|nr:MFS transporter [Oscillospiraceae bacterium]